MLGEKKIHAKYSASGSSRWIKCPGSIALSDRAPEQPESKYAKEGTEAHEVVEYLLKNRKQPLAAAGFLKKKYPLQMIVHAESTLKYVEKRLREFSGAELFIEVRADLPVSEPGQFGTADIVIAEHFGRLIVIDYKYGAGIPVLPEENSQLIYYALGVAHQFDYNFSDVELVVVQPRNAFGGDTIRSWTTTVERLLDWREKFEQGIKRAKEAEERGPEKYLLSGDHCRFCPAKVFCPEIKNKPLRDAQAVFDDDTGTLEVLELNSNFGGVRKHVVTPEFLAKALPAVEKLEVWIAAVREIATQLLESGGTIPGYGLVDKRGQRKWTDYDRAVHAAVSQFGNEALAEPELLSPAQLEKISAKAKKFVEEFSSVVSSGKTLGKVEKPFDDGGETGQEVKTLPKKRRLSKTKQGMK